MNVLYHDNSYDHDGSNASYGYNAYGGAYNGVYALVYGGDHNNDLDNPGRNRYKQQ